MGRLVQAAHAENQQNPKSEANRFEQEPVDVESLFLTVPELDCTIRTSAPAVWTFKHCGYISPGCLLAMQFCIFFRS